MTAKSRRRKAVKRVRRLDGQQNEMFSFYHRSRIVEVVAPDAHEAKTHFQATYGYWPETVQERLK